MLNIAAKNFYTIISSTGLFYLMITLPRTGTEDSAIKYAQ